MVFGRGRGRGSAGCKKQEGSESGSRLRLRLADWFWTRDTRDFNEGRGRWQNTMARCRRRVVPARKCKNERLEKRLAI